MNELIEQLKRIADLLEKLIPPPCGWSNSIDLPSRYKVEDLRLCTRPSGHPMDFHSSDDGRRWSA